MSNIHCAQLKEFLLAEGAALVGFADMTVLPEEKRFSLPNAVSIGVIYHKETIETISEYPTRVYCDEYKALNKKLDALAEACAEKLRQMGFKAIARTTGTVESWQNSNDIETLLPHKTAARLSGLGWIGKSALLVNDRFGSMVRYTTVLTDAPLETGVPIDESRCGNCMACTNACPGSAVKGKNWAVGAARNEILNAVRCRETAHSRSLEKLGEDVTICGKCIFICPYTQRYLKAGK